MKLKREFKKKKSDFWRVTETASMSIIRIIDLLITSGTGAHSLSPPQYDSQIPKCSRTFSSSPHFPSVS